MSETLVQTKMKKMKIFFEGNKKARYRRAFPKKYFVTVRKYKCKYCLIPVKFQQWLKYLHNNL